MAVRIEGIGDDWLVTRQPGGRVKVHTFSSPMEIPALFRKLLSEEGPPPSPSLKPHRLNGAGHRKQIPVVTKAEARVPECQDCGACCLPEDQAARHYVGLDADDVLRLPRELQAALVGDAPGGPSMITKKHEGRRACQAFEGQAGGSCSCSIYSRRPKACQVFERGSEECARARMLLVVGVPG